MFYLMAVGSLTKGMQGSAVAVRLVRLISFYLVLLFRFKIMGVASVTKVTWRMEHA